MRVVDVVEPRVGDTVVTIDGAESTADEVEVFFVVIGDAEIVVLHEGDVDEPGVGPKIGSDIVGSYGGEAVLVDGDTEHGDDGDQSNIRDDDAPLVGLLEDGGRGLEVVAALFAIILRGDVEAEVGGPAKEEHAEELEEGDDGAVDDGFLEGLRKTRGDEDGVLSEVVGELVVISVGDTPRVIGDKESSVNDETDELVDGLGRREGLVSSFVSENPKSGEVETLEEPEEIPDSGVDDEASDTGHPSGSAVVEERNDVRAHDEVEDSNLDKIADQVVTRTGGVLFEVFARDRKSVV